MEIDASLIVHSVAELAALYDEPIERVIAASPLLVIGTQSAGAGHRRVH